MWIAEAKAQPELLENIIYSQEGSLLAEFWIPRDTEVQMKWFKAEDLYIQNDPTSLVLSEPRLKNKAHDLMYHITVWYIFCSKPSMITSHVTRAWESKCTHVLEGIFVKRSKR